ncbi:hypothetical protein LKD70_16295 [Ruminococcus sp. CLA-AA-H200]|uniref:AP2-like integrase N-terminal domain-containing protein n=1 Tax=Ruminococcus turbiniformis TaxID=2881258 RepID=A0ABS8G126_9FIRM|nr:hypothetical protein [Ruminococcus turbiniformis]MCC2255953.1 hypothetical protein [Ruminococcus turbiniformis]
MSKERYATGEHFESGVKGVTWDEGKKKWIVIVNYRGKQYKIMQSSDKDEAIQTMEAADSFILACINTLKEKYSGNSTKK